MASAVEKTTEQAATKPLVSAEEKETKANGMPEMVTPQPPTKLISGLMIVPPTIGVAIASAIYYLGATDKYSGRIHDLVGRDLQWAFLALFVIGRAVAFVNLFPMYHKSMIMKGDSGNLRSNPFIYKAIGEGAKDHAVIFDDEGAVGKYNRANRSLHHMVENNAVVVAGLFMVAQVFPFQAFVCATVWGVGRAFHQVGYSTGDGGHAPGFMLSLLATVVLEGLAVVVAIKGLSIM